MKKDEDRPLVVHLQVLAQVKRGEQLKLDRMGIGALNTAKLKLEWMLKLVKQEITKRKHPR